MVLSAGPYSLDKQKMFVNYTKFYTIGCTDVYPLPTVLKKIGLPSPTLTVVVGNVRQTCTALGPREEFSMSFWPFPTQRYAFWY